MSFVGNFVSEFSITEGLMRDLLLQQSRLRSLEFGILVGFPRTGELITKLRKMIELLPLEQETAARIGECFVQLDHVIKLRDRLVHYGSRVDPHDNSISVYHKPPLAPFAERPKDNFSEEELWAAAWDLGVIRRTFVGHLNRRVPEDVRRKMLSHEQEPWRYKPPPQRPDLR
jgi:hypothetical protein